MKLIINCETNTEVLAEYAETNAEKETRLLAEAAQIEADKIKEKAKIEKTLLLERLGLTEDELKTILS